jgi:hypothetical protein
MQICNLFMSRFPTIISWSSIARNNPFSLRPERTRDGCVLKCLIFPLRFSEQCHRNAQIFCYQMEDECLAPTESRNESENKLKVNRRIANRCVDTRDLPCNMLTVLSVKRQTSRVGWFRQTEGGCMFHAQIPRIPNNWAPQRIRAGVVISEKSRYSD